MTKIFSRKKQIIELTHYLNVTYGHVCTNRLVINELNIKVTILNKTMMAVIGEKKFIKYTVAILTDMRMMLAQLSLGVMSLQENVNAIYEYMRGFIHKKGESFNNTTQFLMISLSPV